MNDRITIEGRDGAFAAYIARPKTLPAPAVVVLHEVFGVNADIRKTCDELAEQGFIAAAPDLFWRQEPGVDLNHWSDAEWKKGLALYAAYDRDKGVRDIIDTADASGQLDGASGKVGVMGFCLGGLMAFLTAAREKIDAAVAYHGGDTEKYLDEAETITPPMLMHLAEEDEFISKEAQAKIKAALSNKPNVHIYTYPGCSHAFARHTGTHYNAEAAARANGRTWQFLKDHLSRLRRGILLSIWGLGETYCRQNRRRSARRREIDKFSRRVAHRISSNFGVERLPHAENTTSAIPCEVMGRNMRAGAGLYAPLRQRVRGFPRMRNKLERYSGLGDHRFLMLRCHSRIGLRKSGED